jgi:PAS domain S-box-containing protein
MVKLAESKYGFVYDYDEPNQRLRMRALSKETYKKCAVSKREYCCQLEKVGILGEAIRQKKAIISSTVQTPNLADNGFPEGNYKISNYLAVPIWRHNKILGIAGVANKTLDYDTSDVQQVSLLINSVWNNLERLEAEKTLAESEQRYRQLIELSQDGILRLDTDGRVLMANPATCKMFGYSEEEMIGMLFSQTMLPEAQEQAQKRWKQLASNTSLRFEREAVRKDGTRFPLEVSISPLTQGYYQEVVRDISTRKEMEFQLQENERKYRQIVDNQSDLIAELSPLGELKFLNPAYSTLLGKSQEEMIGKNVADLIHPEDRERAAKEASPPYSTYSESRMMTKNGWRWIAWTVNGVRGTSGEVTSLTCIGRDITESKQAKEELEQANERLKELDKLKDNFLSTVSHELRTPLTSIKSFSEILLSYDEDPKTQKEFLGIINDESDRLTRLINDFLDISKIQAGRMQWKTQPVSINEAINQALNAARPQIEKEKLQMVSEIEADLPAVLSDKDRLIQVVTNLLGNAIKFTPEGGKISLRAWQDVQTAKKMITVSITDSGIGIAPENHQKIFENFGQVGDVLKDRPKGTGLGLPICKKIIETFGGKIWLESTLGKGSTFFFSLPQAVNGTEVKKEACQIKEVGKADCNKNILVVDDEANIRRLIQHELTEQGFHVIEASGGKEAVDKARRHHPDLITLDISMPDLNGFDVCAVLKNDNETKHIPIIIISVIDDAPKAAALGVDEYLTKPINLEIMLQKINRLLAGANQPKLSV